ncbi:MAG: DUF4142 domain-containing protein [Chloroflexota bacterium]
MMGTLLAGCLALTIVGTAVADDDEGRRSKNLHNGVADIENLDGGNPLTTHNGVAESDRRRPLFYDQEFVFEAASSQQMEIVAGKMAQERAASAEVKQFAQRLLEDHSRWYAELQTVGNIVGASLPTGPATKHDKSVIDSLTKLVPADFDKFYVRAVVFAHRVDLSKSRNSRNENTAPVAGWALARIPTLDEHVRMAETLAPKVGADISSNEELK